MVVEKRVDGQTDRLVVTYLSGEDPTHADDAQDVEDSRAHDGADAHVPFSDEHPCTHNDPHQIHREHFGRGYDTYINVKGLF